MKYIKVFINFCKKTLNWFKENNSFVIALSTVGLLIVTSLYLCETSRIRKTAQKSFEINNSPKVFLGKITPIPRTNNSKKAIEVTLVMKIKNSGNIEAKEVSMNYTFEYRKDENNHSVKGKTALLQYLFPGQEIDYKTKILSLILNEKNFSIVKEAQKQKKSVIPRKGLVPDIHFKLDIVYYDQDNVKKELLYYYKYIFHENILIYENQITQ